MIQAALVCCTCRESIGIQVAAHPLFACEVAGWARDVGWIGIIDIDNARALVFCSDTCVDAQRTKSGGFRRRLKQQELAA